ncbi:uncharacterized protein LOC127104859 [Lathyrus oleraceus]|uniref:uncharacterized protein LOC127104859 n=1 Tax=Pisum sativum TaxID=3888 RepID=UPI0021CFB6B5|nr:uncharacterized protein LOC127104859 [Pisum sativum]
MEDVTIDIGRHLNARNLKSMGVIEQVRVKPSLDTSWEALKDQRKIPNDLYLFSKIDPLEVVAHYLKDLASQGVDISEFSVDWLPEHPPNFIKRQREPSEKSKKAKKAKLGETSASIPPVPLIESPSKSLPPHSRSVNLKQISSSLPQTTPIYTQSEPQPSTTKPSKTLTLNPPSPPFQKFNLSTTTLPISEAEMLNESISPISSTPSSTPYYILSFDSEPSDPQSPTLAQLQAQANTPPPEQPIPPPSEQPTIPPSDTPIIPLYENIIIPTSLTPAGTNQTPPTSPSPDTEPETTFPTLEEAISLFDESLVEKIKSLFVNSNISDDPSVVRIHWNRVIRWMTSESFKLKGLSEQVRNDFIKDDREKLHAWLVREAEENARREAEEKAHLEEEQQVREAVVAAEAEAKVKADAKEAACITAEEAAKTSNDALAQRE